MYGKVHVYTSKEISNQIYIMREMLLHHEDTDGEGRELFHFHFKAWPDHGTPQDPGELHYILDCTLYTVLCVGAVLGYLQDVNFKQTSGAEGTGPVVVHCSAGIGRTGTFIVIDMIINLINHQGTLYALVGHVIIM